MIEIDVVRMFLVPRTMNAACLCLPICAFYNAKTWKKVNVIAAEHSINLCNFPELICAVPLFDFPCAIEMSFVRRIEWNRFYLQSLKPHRRDEKCSSIRFFFLSRIKFQSISIE